jgi:hypothetical protein
MVLSIMVPHFSANGSGGVPPVPPTILMSDGGPLSRVCTHLTCHSAGHQHQQNFLDTRV